MLHLQYHLRSAQEWLNQSHLLAGWRQRLAARPNRPDRAARARALAPGRHPCGGRVAPVAPAKGPLVARQL